MGLPGAIDTLLVLGGVHAGFCVLRSCVNETMCSLVQLRGRTLEPADALYAHPPVNSGSSDPTAAKTTRPQPISFGSASRTFTLFSARS